MRDILLIIVALVSAVSLSAQRPWAEYDVRQQQNIISSKHVSPIVRQSVEQLTSLDDSTREALWQVVTTPIKDKRVASLYLHIYETLRPVENTTPVEDIAVIANYTEYMLSYWGDDMHYYDIYDYAYSLAYHAARGNVADVASILKILNKRRYRKHYAEVIETLHRSYDLIKQSETLRHNIVIDLTAPVYDYDYQPYAITPSEYYAARGSVSRVDCGYDYHDNVSMLALEVALVAGRGYYTPVNVDLGKGVQLIHVWVDPYTEFYVVKDANSVCHTFAAPLYLLADGLFCSVYGYDTMSDTDIITIGRIANGVVKICSVCSVPRGDKPVKCAPDALYVYGEPECLRISFEQLCH